MVRVAHLLPTMEIGGRERIVADLCRLAPDRGVEPLLITYDRAAPGRMTIAVPDVRVIALDRHDPGFRAALATALDRAGVEVLHAQGHVAAALAAGAGATVPILATLHIALGGGWRWLLPVVRGLRAAEHLTAVSADLAERYGRLAGRRIEVVPTGVDLVRFAPADLPRRDRGGPFTIGIAARLHPIKRLQDAVAALRLLDRRGLRCRLVIAGEGACRESLAALASGLDVTLAGGVADMPGFLRGLDAFLLPSDHEGTPAALLEAMASGLPCIATHVGGVPALLGDAGILVPRRDPAAIATAVARLIGDEMVRHRLARAAAARAQAHGLERQAGRYAALYARIRRHAAAAELRG